MADLGSSEVEEFVFSWLERWAGRPAAPTLVSRLKEDVGLDSLGLMELISAIEHRFGVTIDDEQIPEAGHVDNPATVGDIVRLVVAPGSAH